MSRYPILPADQNSVKLLANNILATADLGLLQSLHISATNFQ